MLLAEGTTITPDPFYSIVYSLFLQAGIGGVMGIFCWQLITKSIPGMLNTFLVEVNATREKFSKELSAEREINTQNLKEQQVCFEKTMDRIEKRWISSIEGINNRIETLANKMELFREDQVVMRSHLDQMKGDCRSHDNDIS